MSILSMLVSTANNPDKQIPLQYNTTSYAGTVDYTNFNFKNVSDLIAKLKNKYDDVKFLRINMAKTFSGSYVKPKEIYAENMDHDTYPNCIMVKNNGKYKLIVVKARLAKEFEQFKSQAKNVYVPLFLYRNNNNKVELINFK